MPLFKIFLITLAVIPFGLLLYGLQLHFKTQHSAQQKHFLAGKVPLESLDGFYKGTVRDSASVWQGKKFQGASNTGINVFKEGKMIVDRYPFATSSGKGLADKNLAVIKIDYNLPDNPLWLRFVLDEVVEVSPGHLLGKLHVRLLPGFSLALGFFELSLQE